MILRIYLDTTYFAENWKYCSKIIYKCVNSAVGAIFNESFVEKRGLWVLWTMHGTHWKSHQPHKRASKKKNADADADKLNPNEY